MEKGGEEEEAQQMKREELRRKRGGGRGATVSWPEDSQLPEVVRCLMIASNKQRHDGGHFLTRVVLCMVECQ